MTAEEVAALCTSVPGNAGVFVDAGSEFGLAEVVAGWVDTDGDLVLRVDRRLP